MPHTLLLADDSVTIQRVIELTFADEDIRVVAVGDGKQAIERIQAERPDIVLADVGMPERDGYEVAAFVKGRPDLAAVPVLLLTGAFEPIDEPRARAAGCDGVLVKPFEPQMVINRVKDLLAGRRPASLWAAASNQQPAQPSRQPSSMDLDLRGGQRSGAQAAQEGNASLEDYFDRLDAAFAEFDATPAAPPQPNAAHVPSAPPPMPAPAAQRRDAPVDDVLADWDPELTGDPNRPSKGEPPLAPAAEPHPPQAVLPAPAWTPATVHAPPPPPTPVAVSGPAPASAPAPAFAPEPAPAVTLPHGPSLAEAFAALLAAEQGQAIAPAAIRPADVPESTIDDIVRRVVERVSGESVRGIVLEVAERLVREEIARIKRGS